LGQKDFGHDHLPSQHDLACSGVSVLIALGWIGGRALFRLAESSFWSLNSLAVEPKYVACREVLRHIAEGVLRTRATQPELAKSRATTAAVAGLVLSGFAILVLMLVWPMSRWAIAISDFNSWHLLIRIALANSVALATAYLAVASLVWAFADATMAQPRDLDGFYANPDEGRIWRIAHLSDVHVVGERYGFRIESGRSGPRGDDRLRQAMANSDTLNAKDQLDANPDHRRHDWCRPLRRVGRVPRCSGVPSQARPNES
jgi:hypothetical protein